MPGIRAQHAFGSRPEAIGIKGRHCTERNASVPHDRPILPWRCSWAVQGQRGFIVERPPRTQAPAVSWMRMLKLWRDIAASTGRVKFSISMHWSWHV